VGNTKELPTVISFCSGYGGIERGLELAGVNHRVIAYVEIEAFAIANLVAKMESGQLDAAPIWTDLKTFPAHLFRGAVDIITGGYPCQPFSSAGERKGEDDPRHLWPKIREHIETIRPDRCFFENVEGHISLGLSSVISDLEADGYRTTWGIFSAREVGAPHQRKRVYILADTDSSRQQQSNQKDARQSPEQFNSGGLQSAKIPYPNIEGLQGRLQRGGSNKEGWEKQEIRSPTECCDWGSWYGRGTWSPEPRVGRVVDGCADRVDRIRLLGNAVVPQTAAKAWKTLGERNAKD
jgi:DNA (cytosine-5)-methyltransferase 1